MALATMEPEHARRDVVGMAFDPRRFIQNPLRLPMQAQQLIGDHDAGGQRGRARSQTFADRNVVVDFELDGRQRSAHVARHAQRGLPDQVVLDRSKLYCASRPRTRMRKRSAGSKRQSSRLRAPAQARRSRAPDWRSKRVRGRRIGTVRLQLHRSSPPARFDKPTSTTSSAR